MAGHGSIDPAAAVHQSTSVDSKERNVGYAFNKVYPTYTTPYNGYSCTKSKCDWCQTNNDCGLRRINIAI